MVCAAAQFEHRSHPDHCWSGGRRALLGLTAAVLLVSASPGLAQRIMKDVPEPVRGLEILNHSG